VLSKVFRRWNTIESKQKKTRASIKRLKEKTLGCFQFFLLYTLDYMPVLLAGCRSSAWPTDLFDNALPSSVSSCLSFFLTLWVLLTLTLWITFFCLRPSLWECLWPPLGFTLHTKHLYFLLLPSSPSCYLSWALPCVKQWQNLVFNLFLWYLLSSKGEKEDKRQSIFKSKTLAPHFKKWHLILEMPRSLLNTDCA
jgi:hypothetical protein